MSVDRSENRHGQNNKGERGTAAKAWNRQGDRKSAARVAKHETSERAENRHNQGSRGGASTGRYVQNRKYKGETAPERNVKSDWHKNTAAKEQIDPAVRAFCPAAGRCGGCQLAGMPYAQQLELKQRQVQKLLGSFGKVSPIIGMDEPDHYRNKVHAVLGRRKDGTVISGTYEENSHRLVPVESCRLEDQKADAIIADVRNLLQSFKVQIYNEDSGYGLVRHVLVRVGHHTGQVLVVLVAVSPVFPSKNNFVKALRQKHPEITSVVLNVNDRATSMVLGKRDIVLYGRGYIEDTLCGLTFRISPQSFYQVNTLQTEKLYAKAIEFAGLDGTQRVVDAYCGIGTIGMCAAASAQEVIGVELNPAAVRDARENAKANNIRHISFYEADAGEFLTDMAEQGEQIDVLLMDPPRSGSTPEFLGSALKMRPDRIVYVSCEPTTLARDLKMLTSNGYRCRHIQPVDMFAHTNHVETVVLLSRTSGISKK